MLTAYVVGQCLNHCQLGNFAGLSLENRNPKTIVKELVAKKDYGYLLEVDIRYPKALHDYHNDLPFTCARMKIYGVDKLIPNLYCKHKYVIHMKALVQDLEHGLVPERIHRCIEFK